MPEGAGGDYNERDEVMNTQNRPFYLLIALLFFSFGACRQESKEQLLLNQAEQIWKSEPESALALLDSISLPEELSEPLAVQWSMLYARIADSLHTRLPYPAQMQIAFDYFQSHQLPKEQAEAGLFLGRSLVTDNKKEDAMPVYLVALQSAIDVGDFNQAGYICSYMADLYESDGDYENAISAHQQGNSYFLKADNRRSFAFGLVNKASVHLQNDDTQEALTLLLTADSVAKDLKDTLVLSTVYNGLGMAYIEIGEYSLAEQCILRSIQLDSLDVAPNYLCLSNVYHRMGQLEKAWDCLRKASLSPTDNPYTKTAIHYRRYILEKETGNYENALDDFEQYVTVLDSVYTEENRQNLYDVSERYHYSLMQNQINILKIDRMNYGLLALALACLVAVAVIFYQHRMRLKDRVIQQQNSRLCRVSMELNRKQDQLQVLSSQMKQNELQAEVFMKNQREYEEVRQQVEELKANLTTLKEDYLLQSAIARKLQKLSQSVSSTKCLITDRTWKSIEDLIGEMYPSLISRFDTLKLSVTERRICLLTLFKLDTKELSVLLNIVPDSVNKQRFRVRQKLDLVGKDIDLYQYLLQLVNQSDR